MESPAAPPEHPRLPAPARCLAIGEKWSLYVIHLLGAEPGASANDAARSAASPPMLTVTIRSLERDGLILRTVYRLPLGVEYAVTPLGESLLQAATTLLLWADAHQADLSAARDRYDEANRDRA